MGNARAEVGDSPLVFEKKHTSPSSFYVYQDQDEDIVCICTLPASHVVVLQFHIWRVESRALQGSGSRLCLARCLSLSSPMQTSQRKSATPCFSSSPM